LKFRNIVFINEYFVPAYKAGGPIQSLRGLVENLDDDFNLLIITRNEDLDKLPLPRIKSNAWTKFINTKAAIIYLTRGRNLVFSIFFILKRLNPDIIFVNGIYSIPFNIIPALFFPQKTIMHVRGMLHPGALKQKPFKKYIFLLLFKILRINKRILFCVSDYNEKEFVKKVFGNKTRVEIAQNFPIYHSFQPDITKNRNYLRLGTIALISPIKNHDLVIRALKNVKSNVVWDIYGPIKDLGYWRKCQVLIQSLPENIKVNYCGEIPPIEVPIVLRQIHFMIQPSQSENFGHSLFESIISGRPIITSNFTPWNFLNENKAGYNVELSIESVSFAIEQAASLGQENYNEMVYSSRKYAEVSCNISEIKNQYINIFQKTK
jgi:glycosyltransferase involved in cell wall biosynthesis